MTPPHPGSIPIRELLYGRLPVILTHSAPQFLADSKNYFASSPYEGPNMIERIVTSIIVILLAGYCCHEAAGQGPIRKRLMPQAGPPTSARSAGGITKLPARMAEGTKNAFSGARERLKFWDRTEKRQSSEFVEGTGRFFRPDLARKENERKPFSFVRPASWFEAESDEPGPTSVHDWIGQPRPGFD